MISSRKIILPVVALLASAVGIQAQTNFEWIGGSTGDWSVNSNWSNSSSIPSGKYIGESGTTTAYDRVTIDGNYTVSQSSDVIFWTYSTSDSRKGTFNAITLLNGANLQIDGRLTVASSSSGFNRNALIGAGSTLKVTNLRVGSSNSTGAKSIWTINGAVTAENFEGNYSGTSTLDGGYIFHVNGGSLTVNDTFTWRSLGNVNNVDRVGQINISSDGIVDIGTMALDWNAVEGNFVNFVDGSGSLKFGYDNWNFEAVNGLIASNHIRTAIDGAINVSDAGDGWLVTVNAIPETSTTVALFSAVAFGAVCLARRRRSRA